MSGISILRRLLIVREVGVTRYFFNELKKESRIAVVTQLSDDTETTQLILCHLHSPRRASGMYHQQQFLKSHTKTIQHGLHEELSVSRRKVAHKVYILLSTRLYLFKI